ncbi:MAG: hypothetical protein C5B59_08740 [Bacteroidetes bacterium]|nr:MAG: hypothetical protein C5B59_08740 [Bacteroidota bacterium]
MEEIIRGLYVGSDKDVEKAKERGYARLCMCKDGPDSHREMLGYTTLGAPKGKNYLSVREGDVLAVNILDIDDPTMIPDECIDLGLDFIKEMQSRGRKLLVHCNAGHSRSATTVLMYLRATNEMPESFVRAEKIFRTLYPPYDPGVGMRAHARERWNSLPEFFKKG